jgi:hypothetical protein
VEQAEAYPRRVLAQPQLLSASHRGRVVALGLVGGGIELVGAAG